MLTIFLSILQFYPFAVIGVLSEAVSLRVYNRPLNGRLLGDRATIKTARGILIQLAALPSVADRASDYLVSLGIFSRFFPRRSDLLPITSKVAVYEGKPLVVQLMLLWQ